MSTFRNRVAFISLVLYATLVAVVSTMAGPTTTLTKEQISGEIIGKTLDAKRMGLSVTISYKNDGSLTMKFPIMSGSGTWSYNGNGICMLLTNGPRKGRTCVTFEHLGGNKYRNSEGIYFTVRK